MLDQKRPMMMTVMAKPSLTLYCNFCSRAVPQKKSRQEILAAEPQEARMLGTQCAEVRSWVTQPR